MAQKKILVVEDEAPIQELLKFNLERNRYTVTIVDSGEEAIDLAFQLLPDLILLDIMLPGTDGLDVCKQLKTDTRTQHIPIIMLTALSEESDIIVGLELGADDYVVKPFSPQVLMARVKAALRRNSTPIATADSRLISLHDIQIDEARHKVIVDGKDKTLTYTEFKILQLFIKQPGRVYTRYQIVDAVHGENYPVTDRSVDVQIVGLRKKLGESGKYIETVRGIGYRFKESSLPTDL